MDIDTFSKKFSDDPVVQTAFSASLARKLQTSGLNESQTAFTIGQTPDGGIDSLVVGDENDDYKSQLVVADAAIQSLKEHGVTDMSGIGVLKGKTDPSALNVVYKDGGWVVNTRGINDRMHDAVLTNRNTL